METLQRLTDVDITKSSQALPELIHLRLVNLLLLALIILVAALLLRVEAQVLQQNDLSVTSLVDSLLDLLADAVLGKGHACAQQLFELGNNRLETVLRVGLAVWPAEMAHEHDSFGAVIARIFDCGESADNTLVVGDLAPVKWDVEVDLQGKMLDFESCDVFGEG
jgi:hypothetical protein